MSRIKDILIGAAVGTIAFLLIQEPRVEAMEVETILTDTVTVVKVDTIVHVEPKPYKVETRDSVIITVKDTVYITLPRVVREYHSNDYYAVVSGIDPKLDRIMTFPRTEYKYITRTEFVYQKPQKWGLFLNADYWMTNAGQFMPIGGEFRIHKNRLEYSVGLGKDILSGAAYVKGGVAVKLIER